MAEPLKKASQATFTLTYGSANALMPFTMHVAEFSIDPVAEVVDVTSGSSNRRLGTSGLTGGTVTVTGWLTLTSAVTLLDTVFRQVTTDTDTDTTQKISIRCNVSDTGANAGGTNSGTAAPIVLYGIIERAPMKISKTPGYMAGMVVFRLCGTPV